MRRREMAYLLCVAIALGLVVWFTVPADKPRPLILVVVECAFLTVASYQV